MTIREQYETMEESMLSPYASLSKNSLGREVEEEPCPIRAVYRRDCDRILHSQSFRRLMHKTQVFLSPTGDHYRTRLTHTLEVNQIARTISRALRLNEDLTEAISLGHDLGHTPFGHTGEEVLARLFAPGFQHNEQSLRVVDRLEKNGAGLNLTKEVKDGILCHTSGKLSSSLEGQVVRFADRIAYINHDIEDAIRAGVLTEKDVPESARLALGQRKSERIRTLVVSVIEHSGEDISMAPEHQKEFDLLREFMFQAVYHNRIVKAEEEKARTVIEQLYHYFLRQPSEISDSYRHTLKEEGVERAVCDYISGMTDRYCISLFEELFVPKAWGIS